MEILKFLPHNQINELRNVWDIGHILDENQDVLPLQSFDELKLV